MIYDMSVKPPSWQWLVQTVEVDGAQVHHQVKSRSLQGFKTSSSTIRICVKLKAAARKFL